MHGQGLRAAVAEQRLWERALEALPVATAEELGSDWTAATRQTATDYRLGCIQARSQQLLPCGLDRIP